MKIVLEKLKIMRKFILFDEQVLRATVMRADWRHDDGHVVYIPNTKTVASQTCKNRCNSQAIAVSSPQLPLVW